MSSIVKDVLLLPTLKCDTCLIQMVVQNYNRYIHKELGHLKKKHFELTLSKLSRLELLTNGNQFIVHINRLPLSIYKLNNQHYVFHLN